ncbi:uncharacterized protein LOC126968343 [Leptidea sinapis]|uniref:uncharacterized protein LOC126968343 n=1 Tax=Leptidea sinapis TaxID=189913 RepID=UPI00213039B8|nr:uncharacterized protein LOC126968343 [Leptidea sinapis]
MPVFTANIPGVLKIGDRVEIGGRIKENARKMSINLCAQEGEEPRDVVLHFDVRFHRDNIISLSRRNGVWIGSGNLDTNYNMFVPGTIFRIIFEVKDTDVITIYCQGKFHSNFLPKIPLTMAKYVVAWADVERITHCYFHFGGKGGDEPEDVLLPTSPRATISPVGEKRCSRGHRKQSPGVPIPNPPSDSIESSDDETKVRPKDGRADRFFYDTLLCQPPELRINNHEGSKYRRDTSLGNKGEYSRKYEGDESDSEDKTEVSDVASKDLSSLGESDEIPRDLKKKIRRGKFAPFAQVVNFMGKSGKRS